MAFYYRGTDYIVCTLCPKHCRIPEGASGDCGVRFNRNSELDLPYYGIITALSTDPVEKKPLYHFFPGSPILSAGFFGCSFHCPFCQNHSISQPPFDRENTPYIPPEKLILITEESGTDLLAFTYSEPLVHFEYILRASEGAHEKGIKTVLVTNGYINRKPAKELLPSIDALNIDLKSFRNSFYEEELSGSLKPVLDFIELAKEYSHVEVTTLIIPGANDSAGEMEELSGFLSKIDPDIPLHISAYYPTYKYKRPGTPASKIYELRETALKNLNYVYPGNVRGGGSDTHCPECGSLLIKRSGYTASVTGMNGSRCANCGKEISGMYR